MTVNIKPLSPELALLAETELDEVPSRIQSDLEHLKLWLSKQKHLKACTDDQFLIAFLRGCKYSLERVKEKIDMYYTMRTAVPEFFQNRDPRQDRIKIAMQHGITLPLPYTEFPDSPRIFLIRIGAFNPKSISVEEFMKVCYMVTDILMWDDPNTCIAGHIVLVDLQGCSFSQLTQFPASLVRKMTTGVQEAYPIRQKGMHFVNPPTGFDALYKLFSSFLKDKFKKRLKIHDSFESLHLDVPKRLLPKEYGGEAGEISGIIDYWSGVLAKKRLFFLKDEQFRADEKLRVGKSNREAIFGVDGSFRSLGVD